MSLRVDLLDVSEQRAGFAALVRSVLRLVAIAACGGIALLLFIGAIQLWQSRNHVQTLERTWEMLESRSLLADRTLAHLRSMEQTHAELSSWKTSHISAAQLLKALPLLTPTNMQLTVFSMSPIPRPQDAPAPKVEGAAIRQAAITISGIVRSPAANDTVTTFSHRLEASPATSNIVQSAGVSLFDANYKTPNDDGDYIFSIAARTWERPQP